MPPWLQTNALTAVIAQPAVSLYDVTDECKVYAEWLHFMTDLFIEIWDKIEPLGVEFNKLVGILIAWSSLIIGKYKGILVHLKQYLVYQVQQFQHHYPISTICVATILVFDVVNVSVSTVILINLRGLNQANFKCTLRKLILS